jgi:hypothetical protein
MSQIPVPFIGSTGATGPIGPTINNLSTTPLFNPTTPYYISDSSGGGTGSTGSTGSTGPTGASGGTDGRLFTSIQTTTPFTSVSIPVNGTVTLATYTIPITLATGTNLLQNLDVEVIYESGAILVGDEILLKVSKQIGSSTNFFNQTVTTTPSPIVASYKFNPVAVQQQINIAPTSVVYSVIATFTSTGATPIVITGSAILNGLITAKPY